ncbi:hypothetical protein Tco_0914268 [Tanacetum coccineum]
MSKNTGAGEKKTLKKPSETSRGVLFKELLDSGQTILVDEAGNHLKKVESPGDYDSEYEVASVDNDMTRSLTLEMGQKHSGLSACMLGPASEDLDHAALAMFASGSK